MIQQHLKLATWAFVLISLAATSKTQGEWQNSLKPDGPAAGTVELVRDGKAVRTIRIEPNATAIEKNAAAELQNWIEQITAVPLAITTADSGPSIRLRTDPALGEEGYRIAIEGNDLLLTGGTRRGVMNAVFALLEEDLGCRFYTNESIRLPKSSSLTVQPVVRSFVPKLRLRDPLFMCAIDATWSLRNRTNSPSAAVTEDCGGHVDYGGLFVHTEAQLLSSDRYFKDHPDYFALNTNGERYTAQLCPTHPEVIKIVTAAVLDVLKAHPDAEIVSVSKNDSGGDQICYCQRCKSIRTDEGSEIGCQLILVNAVAEAVEKKYPGALIDTLAYIETLQPPKNARLRANVAIRLCNDSISLFAPAKDCSFGQTMVTWAKVHNRLFVWDYNTNFHHYLAPVPNVDVMASNIRFFAENHVEGIMLQGAYQGPGDGDEMKSWVTSKVLWDPARDDKALVQDFLWGHYGAAAPAMAEYEELRNGLRRTYVKEMSAPPGGVNFPIEAPFIDKEFVDKATTLFAQAKQLATGDEPLLRRVERAELSILYVTCSRGPEFTGPTYGADVAAFERIARREGLQYLTEGGANFESTLAKWKAQVPNSAPAKP